VEAASAGWLPFPCLPIVPTFSTLTYRHLLLSHSGQQASKQAK